jgi:16S rRNA (guanine527-N7)-methyltransferase
MTLLQIDGPESFARAFSVPHEVIERLEIYADLLQRWQKSMNLVARSALSQIWLRHFADSAQLLPHARDAKIWADLGTGGGFPGLVIAILLTNHDDRIVRLLESNGRKCAFLQEAARRTRAPVEILEGRIEDLASSGRAGVVDIVTSRALAPLDRLLGLARPLFGPQTRGLFLKGREARNEIAGAMERWRFEWKLAPSQTDEEGQIIEVGRPDLIWGERPKT